MPDELAAQFDIAKSAPKFSVCAAEPAGYEADDILGTVARAAEEAGGIETYIVTGDRDSLQLIDGNTTVLPETSSGTVKYDTGKFIETYGLAPGSLSTSRRSWATARTTSPGCRASARKPR